MWASALPLTKINISNGIVKSLQCFVGAFFYGDECIALCRRYGKMTMGSVNE